MYQTKDFKLKTALRDKESLIQVRAIFQSINNRQLVARLTKKKRGNKNSKGRGNFKTNTTQIQGIPRDNYE